MRLKQSTRVKKSRRSKGLTFATFAKGLARARKKHEITWEAGVTALVAVAFCVAVGAMLSVAIHSGDRSETTIARAGAPASAAPAAAAPVAWVSDDIVPESTTAKAAAPTTPVTITGCLEQDDDTFRLKNTSGAEAPKARSWKSGFLKKNSATIEVVDASNAVKLPSHVGQRVVVTGTLVDREMQVRSLKRIAASCNQTA